jgi:quercetin dioxygenase-like cupin family protein
MPLEVMHMPSITHIPSISEYPKKAVTGEVQRRVLSTRNIMIVQYFYKPEATFPEHHHPEEQIVIVDEGEIEFEVGGASYRLGRKGILVIPSNVPHSSHVVGDGPVTTYNIFHPIREDLLDEVIKG